MTSQHEQAATTPFAQAVQTDQPQPPQSKCTIAQLLRNGALQPSDVALMAELWDTGNGEWNLPRITKTLRTATHTDIGVSTVGRHLRGNCKCGQA